MLLCVVVCCVLCDFVVACVVVDMCCSLIVVGWMFVVVRCLLFDICCLLFVGCVLFVVCFGVARALIVVYRGLLLVVYCVLFVVLFGWLFVVLMFTYVFFCVGEGALFVVRCVSCVVCSWLCVE